jgi:transglutaminase-like putative cysteine protease
VTNRQRPATPLQRWRQLPADERRLALRLLWLLPLIDLSLRGLGFQRSRGWLARFAHTDAAAPVDSAALTAAQRLAWLARAIGARSPWRTSCLRQALAVWLLLRRRGLPAEIRIGVVRRDPPFQAHAWVELGDVALDPEAAAYKAFPAIPHPPASAHRP